MKRTFATLISASLLLAAFSPARAEDRNLEQYAIDTPSVSSIAQSLARLNQTMHYAGTPGDHDLANWMRDQLAANGLDATIESFSADVSLPKKVSLAVLNGRTWEGLDLREAPIAHDTDGSRSDVWIPFNAFSGNGDVTASVVDAGHGLESDYEALRAAHVDVRTRVALVRYGREFRGNLARRAQEHGAAGVIFFSDPADRDGASRGIAYPDGPQRPLGSVQRGSLGETTHIKIPVLPITALNEQRIARTMHNRLTTTPVHMHVAEVVKRETLWNTVGILRGTDPSHTIVLGAHRDAWVYGVTDNGSGISIMVETARALGYLYRSGWRPRFSIVIVGFDGEEIGEAGSQAYVRMHQGELQSGCIAYINSDEGTTGQHFDATAAAALEDAIAPVTLRVADPRSPKQTMYDRWKQQKDHVTIDGPGGGSDFEPFLYDAGVPILELGFNGVFGVYHSAYDDLRYAQTQADPGLVNHRAIAQSLSLLAMRLADGTLAYRFTPYVTRMRTSLAQLASTSHMSSRDVAPVFSAIGRFANRAAEVDRIGMDGNQEIAAAHRINKLYYGRNGYAAVAFPDLAAALDKHDAAGISAAVGRTAHSLDEITSTMHR